MTTTGDHRTLSAEREQELARRIQAGRDPIADEATRADALAARNELVECNRASATHVARKIGGRLKMDLDDSYGWAVVGLVKAADRFEPRGIRFSTLAFRMMRQTVSEAWQTTNFAVPMRSDHVSHYLRLRAGEPTSRPLTPRHAEMILRMGRLTFGAKRLGSEGWSEPAASTTATDELAERADDLARIRSALALVPEPYRGVISRYYGLGGSPPETLEAIGETRGVTRERVQQIRDEGLRRVRKILRVEPAGAKPSRR